MMRRCRAALFLVVSLGLFPFASRAETHAALGSRVELNVPINPRYPGTDGAGTLTDGVTGKTNFGKSYLGFEGLDIEATVTLPVATKVHTIAADFLQYTPPAIFFPVSVDIAVSENGRNFRTLTTLQSPPPKSSPTSSLKRFELKGLDLTLKAIRIRAANGGRVPSWHHSPGALRWTFISEILVNPGETPVSAMDLLANYTFGESRWPLTTVESMLRRDEPARRRQHCDALRALLGKPETTLDAKKFCLEQLALFGDRSDVEAVAACLSDANLARPACRTLIRLGGEKVEAILAAAVQPESPELAAEALHGLGKLGSPKLLAAAETALGDDTLRPAALAALGELGNPAAQKRLLLVFPRLSGSDKIQGAEALLACGRAALETGDAQRALAAFDAVRHAGPTPVQRVAALAGTVRAGQNENIIPLLHLAADPDESVARAALSLGADLVTTRGPTNLGPAFEKLPDPARIVCIRAVGKRGRADDAPWLRQRLRVEKGAARAATLRALAHGGSAADIPDLLAALQAENQAEQEAAEETLQRLAGDDVDAALVRLGAGVPESVRPALGRIYASRRTRAAIPLLLTWTETDRRAARRDAWQALSALVDAKDMDRLLTHVAQMPAAHAAEAAKTLRLAAVSEPATAQTGAKLAAALQRAADDEHRIVLIPLVAKTAPPGALDLLQHTFENGSPPVKSAVVRALADWPNAAPLAMLSDILENETDETLDILAQRGGLTLLSTHADTVKSETATRFFQQAYRRVSRPEERCALVRAAAGFATPATTHLVLDALKQADTAETAETALLDHALSLWPLAPSAIRAALQGLATRRDAGKKQLRAAALLKKLPPPDVLQRIETTSWTSLFNGKDLTGWRVINGKKDAWEARDGLLIARRGGGGWLARTEEESDYLIEFDVKLPAGGNSGLFLRPPLRGNPAWEGIEVQLLDDDAPQYATVRPDQRCGSIYAIAAADPRVSRPAGTWQHLRVLCADRLVVVWLNGVHVAQANLDDHMDKKNKIPGLTRSRGFPGLQNEHGPIEFRALRLKSLTTPGKHAPK